MIALMPHGLSGKFSLRAKDLRPVLIVILTRDPICGTAAWHFGLVRRRSISRSRMIPAQKAVPFFEQHLCALESKFARRNSLRVLQLPHRRAFPGTLGSIDETVFAAFACLRTAKKFSRPRVLFSGKLFFQACLVKAHLLYWGFFPKRAFLTRKLLGGIRFWLLWGFLFRFVLMYQSQSTIGGLQLGCLHLQFAGTMSVHSGERP